MLFLHPDSQIIHDCIINEIFDPPFSNQLVVVASLILDLPPQPIILEALETNQSV